MIRAMVLMLALSGCATPRCSIEGEQVAYQGETDDNHTVQVRTFLEKCRKYI